VLLNLVGYAVGTVVLSPIGDRVGRKKMLMVTLMLTGLGSLYNALAPDYVNFVIARTITGIGIGADLALATRAVHRHRRPRTPGQWLAVGLRHRSGAGDRGTRAALPVAGVATLAA
jgi:MFS family permease